MWPCQANTPIARPPTPSATPAVTVPAEYFASKSFKFFWVY